MNKRTYTLDVEKGRTSLSAESGVVLGTADREVDATDLLAMMADLPAGTVVQEPPPKPSRWLERILLVVVTTVLVYNYGALVMWYLTDTSDHLIFYYGSRP